MTKPDLVSVRETRAEDFDGITALSREVYPASPPWHRTQLASHLDVFPEGQFVAVEKASGRVVGMSASLIVRWDDYSIDDSWHDFTDGGMFTSHDPERGRTLYGAEVMVSPSMRGRRIGSLLYEARQSLVERLGLLRIRAGARLAGYHRVAGRMTAEEYTIAVVRGELRDPTLTFQLARGFHVIAVVGGYLIVDPESRGYAAVIEWINARVARSEDYAHVPERFQPLPPAGPPRHRSPAA